MPTKQAPFPIDPVYTAIAVAYSNSRLIADDVMPRVPVGKREFKHMIFDLAEGFTVPDTRVGRKSAPNEVEFSASETTNGVEDFGLDDPIPQDDIDNAPMGYDPLGHAVESITDLILLDREVRVANMMFNPANYTAANQTTLAGTDHVDDASFDVIGFFMDTLDSMVMRGNQVTMSRPVASKLARHPDILKSYNKNSGDKGIAPLQYIADLFELEKINVGEARVNLNQKGQTPSLSRCWADYIAFHFTDGLADTRHRVTFAYTAQYKSRVSGAEADSKIGLRGGQRVRVGESVKELITASDLGHLVISPLTP